MTADTSSATRMGTRAGEAYRQTGQVTPNPFGREDDKTPPALLAFIKAWGIAFANSAWPAKK
jgi:hypothetical protein